MRCNFEPELMPDQFEIVWKMILSTMILSVFSYSINPILH